MARNLFVVATIAAACAVAIQAKSEYKVDGVAFAIDATCGQIGAAPANLTSDLPTGRGETGYNYNCYQPGDYVKKWSTIGGFPKGMLQLVDDTGTCHCDSEFEADLSYLRPYFESDDVNAISVVAPFLIFGFLATIFLTCWSCGTMKCCCCKFCNRPPAFTKGKVGLLLTFITAALGGAAAILAIRGIAGSAQQDVALNGIRDTFLDLAQWPNNTIGQLEEPIGLTTTLLESNLALQVTVNTLGDEVKTPVIAGLREMRLQLAEAQNYMTGAKTLMDDLAYNLYKKSDDMAGIFNGDEGKNNGVAGHGLKKTVLFLLWLVIVGLMGLQIVITLLRRLAPQKTQGCLCNCTFELLTSLSIMVMLILFFVSTVVYLVLMVLSDLCTDPDNILRGVMLADTCQVRLHTDGLTMLYNDNCAFTLADDGVTKVYAIDVASAVSGTDTPVILPQDGLNGDGIPGNLNRDPNLLGYFMTCDTKVNATNPFNIELERMMDGISAAQVVLGADFFAAFEASAAYGALVADADATNLTKYKADKKSVVDAIAPLAVKLQDLSEVLSGNRSAAAIDWDANEGQGLTQGTLSQFNCYQGNSRYNTMIHMLCDTVFESIAQTCEYFMAAAVLMIIIQCTKRWSRPYGASQDDEDGEDGGDDGTGNKLGGDPVVNSLMAL